MRLQGQGSRRVNRRGRYSRNIHGSSLKLWSCGLRKCSNRAWSIGVAHARSTTSSPRSSHTAHAAGSCCSSSLAVMCCEASQQDGHKTRAIDHLLQLLSTCRRVLQAPNHEPVAQRGTHRRRLCLSEQRIGCAWSAQCSTGCGRSRGRRGFKVYHLTTTAGGARESSAGWQNDAVVYLRCVS